jgi:hypothetical protein
MPFPQFTVQSTCMFIYRVYALRLKILQNVLGYLENAFCYICYIYICGFAIYGLRHLGNLRIRDLRSYQYKFRICDLRTGTLQKFAELRLRNEHNNLRISNLQTNKKLCMPTFAIHTVHSPSTNE